MNDGISMGDLAVGLGLVLVIEGLLWAAFPHAGVQLLEAVKSIDRQTIRLYGATAMAIGVIIVWLARG